MNMHQIHDIKKTDQIPFEIAPEIELPDKTLNPEPNVQRLVDIFRQQRPLKRGLVLKLWKLSTPFSALGIWAGAASADPAILITSIFCLATALQINKIASLLDTSQRTWKSHDVNGKWIGVMGEALLWPDKRIRKQASLMLTRLLQQMSQHEADLLTPEQRTNLLQHINMKMWKRDPDLVIALIRGVALWNDPQILPSLYHIAASKPRKYPQKELISELRGSIVRLERSLLKEGIPIKLAVNSTTIQTHESEVESKPVFSPEALERISKLNEETQERIAGMRLGFLLATWLIIVPYTGYQAVLGILHKSPLQMISFTMLMLLSTQLYRLTLSKKQSEAAYKLALAEDVNAVGSLAETLDWPDVELNGAARRALTKLLPRLKASDSHLLNDTQRQSLYKRLRMSHAVKNMGFTLAVLKSLEQIGDKSAVPYVQLLAESTSHTHSETRIREAAIECLPFLKIRAESTHNTQTLLRASSAEQSPKEMLLRPAANSSEAFPEQLLRAVSLNEEI